jgi:hypothetical protein
MVPTNERSAEQAAEPVFPTLPVEPFSRNPFPIAFSETARWACRNGTVASCPEWPVLDGEPVYRTAGNESGAVIQSGRDLDRQYAPQKLPFSYDDVFFESRPLVGNITSPS